MAVLISRYSLAVDDRGGEGGHAGVHVGLVVVEVGGDAQSLGLLGDEDAALAEEAGDARRIGYGAQGLAGAEHTSGRKDVDALLLQAGGQARVEREDPLGDRIGADGREVIDRRAEGEDRRERRATQL